MDKFWLFVAAATGAEGYVPWGGGGRSTVPTAGRHGRGFKCQRGRGTRLPFGLDEPRAKGLAARRGGTVLRVPGTPRSPSAIYHAAAGSSTSGKLTRAAAGMAAAAG